MWKLFRFSIYLSGLVKRRDGVPVEQWLKQGLFLFQRYVNGYYFWIGECGYNREEFLFFCNRCRAQVACREGDAACVFVKIKNKFITKKNSRHINTQ